jgi:hypothetical protein
MNRIRPNCFNFVLVATAFLNGTSAGQDNLQNRHIVFNLDRHEVIEDVFERIESIGENRAAGAPQVGAGIILSYFAASRDDNLQLLRKCLRLADRHRVGVVIQLDGEQWWDARPDLWNWWDPQQRGFDPENVSNVEWSGWSPEQALKIAWRNWGTQIRIVPPPNLMSARYRAACHKEMRPLLAEIVAWKRRVEVKDESRLIGVKVGWESSIGLNAYYYADGNKIINADPSVDPKHAIQEAAVPGRGFVPTGYAAIATSGLASGDELREEHLAEVIRRHLSDLASVVYKSGIPREQIFVHCGGWADGEALYVAANNEFSCPGWSFYTYAADPSRNRSVMIALSRSDAPYWAAAEWYLHGDRTANDWASAIRATLSIERCRYVGIFNWRDVEDNGAAMEGIAALIQGSTVPQRQSP